MNENSKDDPPHEKLLPDKGNISLQNHSAPMVQPAAKITFWKSKLLWQFAIGFLGWFIAVGIFWGVAFNGRSISSIDVEEFFFMWLCPMSINLFALVVLAAYKSVRGIAFGILAAMGTNLLISLILGLETNAACMVPFIFE
jgi:hypothetical protein